MDEAIVIDPPAEGWRGDDSLLRFIQFRFNEKSFDLDIPNTTLSRREAEIILRRRSGFFHAVERLDLEHPTNRDITKRFSPLRKMYVNGDESSAAEDMGFISIRHLEVPRRLDFLRHGGGVPRWPQIRARTPVVTLKRVPTPVLMRLMRHENIDHNGLLRGPGRQRIGRRPL